MAATCLPVVLRSHLCPPHPVACLSAATTRSWPRGVAPPEGYPIVHFPSLHVQLLLRSMVYFPQPDRYP